MRLNIVYIIVPHGKLGNLIYVNYSLNIAFKVLRSIKHTLTNNCS